MTKDQPTRKGKKGGHCQIKKVCANPDCRQEFIAFSARQKYCLNPACREIQREKTKENRAEWWRKYRAGTPTEKERRQKQPTDKKCCFLCGRPLLDGERINHVACIEKRSYRRIDGDYLYV